MYYLYKKSKSIALPRFSYTFAKFEDFYLKAKVLTASLVDSYCIRIKSDSYKDVLSFINASGNYDWLNIYIETTQSVIDFVTLSKPGVSLLSSKSNWEVFESLISRYGILFDRGCIRILYMAIDHEYESMVEALELIKQEYPNQIIKEKEIESLFVVDKLVYPRSVCIAYLRLDRWRKSRALKCIDYFGNDLVLYAIRKNVVSFLKEKTTYLRTGTGSNLIKTIPVNNIVRLYNCMHAGRAGYMNILTILEQYEKGETINDTLQERALSYSDEECDVARRCEEWRSSIRE